MPEEMDQDERQYRDEKTEGKYSEILGGKFHVPTMERLLIDSSILLRLD